MMKTYVTVSSSGDVYDNLAYEKELFATVGHEYLKCGTTAAALMLWENSDCVVIGRNQNPYRECDLSYMQSNGIKLARRMTGGGAVFHDKGNLNFTFILSRDIYDPSRTTRILTDAFLSVGIPVEISGRNDILVDGRKFSGNAFRLDGGAWLHHGTVLINASTEKISKCLTPSKPKLEAKGVASVKARTVNLKALFPDITAKKISEAVTSSFLSEFGAMPCDAHINQSAIESSRLTFSSDEWLYDGYADEWKNCKNTQTRFPWGCIEITEQDGVVIGFSTDALDADFSVLLKKTIENNDRVSEELRRLSEIETGRHRTMINDIISVIA